MHHQWRLTSSPSRVYFFIVCLLVIIIVVAILGCGKQPAFNCAHMFVPLTEKFVFIFVSLRFIWKMFIFLHFKYFFLLLFFFRSFDIRYDFPHQHNQLLSSCILWDSERMICRQFGTFLHVWTNKHTINEQMRWSSTHTRTFNDSKMQIGIHDIHYPLCVHIYENSTVSVWSLIESLCVEYTNLLTLVVWDDEKDNDDDNCTIRF